MLLKELKNYLQCQRVCYLIQGTQICYWILCRVTGAEIGCTVKCFHMKDDFLHKVFGMKISQTVSELCPKYRFSLKHGSALT